MALTEDDDMTVAIKTAKNELRKSIGTALRKLTEDNVKEQSLLVQSKLFSLPEYQNAKTLSIFLSMPLGEIQTEPIVHHAFDHGKSVFIPYLRRDTGRATKRSKSVMDMVELFSKDDFDKLQPDQWGIPSLNHDSVQGRMRSPGDHDSTNGVKFDLIVMPGVAFDKKLNRLGHGKGYYDFFLSRYVKSAAAGGSAPFLVAVALKEQVLQEDQDIPVDVTDWPVDALITGDGQLARRRES